MNNSSNDKTQCSIKQNINVNLNHNNISSIIMEVKFKF